MFGYRIVTSGVELGLQLGLCRGGYGYAGGVRVHAYHHSRGGVRVTILVVGSCGYSDGYRFDYGYGFSYIHGHRDASCCNNALQLQLWLGLGSGAITVVALVTIVVGQKWGPLYPHATGQRPWPVGQEGMT